jgi:hypothetical protein
MTYPGYLLACTGACAAFSLSWVLISYAEHPPRAGDARTERTRAALHGAVEKNLEYGREWLEGKDFKSLALTGEGLVALAQLLSRLSDEERWQISASELTQSAKALTEAARKEEETLTKLLLAKVGQRNKSLAELTLAGKLRPPQRPGIPLRSFMALMDGTHADAKAALTFSEIDRAKQMGYVLAELGHSLAAHRADANWLKLSRDFSAAATAAAESASRDAKEIREQLRTIYRHCEACHDARR